MLKRPNYFSKFLPSRTACLVLPGPALTALTALKIIYTGLAVISLHNGPASNISLTTHHTTRDTLGGTTWNIFGPNNFPGDRKTENIIFFKVRNNEEDIHCF